MARSNNATDIPADLIGRRHFGETYKHDAQASEPRLKPLTRLRFVLVFPYNRSLGGVMLLIIRQEPAVTDRGHLDDAGVWPCA